MKIDFVIQAIQADRVNITQHARKEAKEDGLKLDEIFFSVRCGELIEDYPEDFPYPSCLIYGKTAYGIPIHSVWAYDHESQVAILVTVYRPDPKRWIDWKQRK